MPKGFDPQALTSLTTYKTPTPHASGLFRSTGSYEPDQASLLLLAFKPGFDPQALTSLTIVPSARSTPSLVFRSTGSYEPDPKVYKDRVKQDMFRSTGSYEPDLHLTLFCYSALGFDPQALTSLTHTTSSGSHHTSMFRSTGSYEPDP